MDFSFRHSYEVRYDECNLYGWLTPVAVLRYLQDIAGLHVGRANLSEEGNWVAHRTVVEFGPVSLPARTTLEIETYPLGFTKVTAQRAYDLRVVAKTPVGSTSSEPAIRARTMWVYLDGRGKPARIPASYYDFWTAEELRARSQMTEAPWPQELPDRPPFSTIAPVQFSDLDVMGHMNNAAYVELLDNAAWETLQQTGLEPEPNRGYPAPLHYDVEYLESARLGDKLEINSWFQPLPEGSPNDFERLEQVKREGKLVLRARSRWRWQEGEAGTPSLSRLWTQKD